MLNLELVAVNLKPSRDRSGHLTVDLLVGDIPSPLKSTVYRRLSVFSSHIEFLLCLDCHVSPNRRQAGRSERALLRKRDTVSRVLRPTSRSTVSGSSPN